MRPWRSADRRPRWHRPSIGCSGRAVLQQVSHAFRQEVKSVSIGFGTYWNSAAAALVMAIGGHAAAQVAPAPTAAQAATAAPAAAAGSGQDLVRTHCSGCHRERAGEFERISGIRKTPEGWAMTLFRMRQVHGVVLDDP